MKLLRFIEPTVALIVALLAGLSGLAAAGQSQKPTKCSQAGQMAEWSGYSNGITTGGEKSSSRTDASAFCMSVRSMSPWMVDRLTDSLLGPKKSQC